MIVGRGDYKCQICNTLSESKLQHQQHKVGNKHRLALATVGHKKTEKSFYCKHCKYLCDVKHHHCQLCDVHCHGPVPYQAHLNGNPHKNKESSRDVDEPSQRPQSEASDHLVECPHYQCPVCQEGFQELAKLKVHVKASHDLIITCKECEAMGHNPAGQVLLCQELIAHLSDIHNKPMTCVDLPFFGRKGNGLNQMATQGYVSCQLCPKPSYESLGSPGVWFTNRLNLTTVKTHFAKYHPESASEFLHKTVLGCQLCQEKLPGVRESQWAAHLTKHRLEGRFEDLEEGEIFTSTTGTAPSSICPYCGERVPREGIASQQHIKENHLHLTFTCKLCPLRDRYYYESLQDVFRHLQLKHIGRHSYQHVVFPGTRSDLGAFAWVKCKTCDFRGIGYGEEIWSHLRSQCGLVHPDIFCRLCHKDERGGGAFVDFIEFEEHFERRHYDIIQCLSSE